VPNLHVAPVPALSMFGNCDADEGETEVLSPICIRISSAVHVNKENCLICLQATPSEQANPVARVVLGVLEETNSAHCGIPIIDEEGWPRPIKIEVDLGLVVEGLGNVTGGEQLISHALRQRQVAAAAASYTRRRRRVEKEEDEDDDARNGRPSNNELGAWMSKDGVGWSSIATSLHYLARPVSIPRSGTFRIFI
jgi:hypothetical protein